MGQLRLLGQPRADHRIDCGASTLVTTRHSVVFDGPSTLDTADSRQSRSAGTSAAQPAIAVNDLIPASTTAAHNVNTTATG